MGISSLASHQQGACNVTWSGWHPTFLPTSVIQKPLLTELTFTARNQGVMTNCPSWPMKGPKLVGKAAKCHGQHLPKKATIFPSHQPQGGWAEADSRPVWGLFLNIFSLVMSLCHMNEGSGYPKLPDVSPGGRRRRQERRKEGMMPLFCDRI